MRFCIVLSLIMGLLFAGKPVDRHGTVCAVMLVGRVIALFHHNFWKGDAAGGWTGKWQELTECVEKGVRKIKAADF